MAIRKHKGNKFTTLMQKKLLIVFGVFILLLIILSVRVISINVNKGYDYSKEVYNNFNYDSRTIPARRGDITDRNGTVLAYSTKVYNLIVDSKLVLSDEKYRQPTVDALLDNFDIDGDELNSFLDENESKIRSGEKPSSYRIFMSELSADDIKPFNDKMKEKNSNIKGVWFEEQYKRTYPYGSFACDLIGFASDANGGETGIESSYEKYLAGSNGRVYGYIDDNSYETNRKNAVNGNTVVTTIDYTIQDIIENEIRSFNEEYGSNEMSIAVMNPNNGEILAMADYPEFDLNNPRDMSGIYNEEYFNSLSDEEKVEKMYDVWKNFGVSTLYEPGSVFKPFTVAASMEEEACVPQDTFVCDGGETIDNSRILCNGGVGHGKLTLAGALEQSCNDCLMQIGAKLGPDKFLKYLDVFKFGTKTDIDLNGEENGIIKDIDGYMDVDLATNAFGQNINVTMVQMMSAFSSLINGGYYYKPHTVKEIRSESGDVIEKYDPVIVTQTVSSETSRTMRGMLRSVIDYGTAYLLRMDGYSVGGKTGTAEKAGRNKKNYVVSFMCFAPAENPQVLVYVVIDTPRCMPYDTAYSPQYVSRRICEKLFPYMGIPRDNADYDCDIYYDAADINATAHKQPNGPTNNIDPPLPLPEGFSLDEEVDAIRVKTQGSESSNEEETEVIPTQEEVNPPPDTEPDTTGETDVTNEEQSSETVMDSQEEVSSEEMTVTEENAETSQEETHEQDVSQTEPPPDSEEETQPE